MTAVASLAAPVPSTGVGARRVLVKVLLTGLFVCAAWLCGSAVASATTLDAPNDPASAQQAEHDPVGGLVNGTTTLLNKVTAKLPVVGDVVHNVTSAVTREPLPELPKSNGGLIPQLPPLLPSTGGVTGGWISVGAPTATMTTEKPARAEQTARRQHVTTHRESTSSAPRETTTPATSSGHAKQNGTGLIERNSHPRTVSAPLNRDKTPSAPDPVPDPAAPTASVGHPGPSGDRTSMAAITNNDAGSASAATHGERRDTQYPLGADDGLPSVSPD